MYICSDARFSESIVCIVGAWNTCYSGRLNDNINFVDAQRTDFVHKYFITFATKYCLRIDVDADKICHHMSAPTNARQLCAYIGTGV